MPIDPYTVLRALLRAEAARSALKPPATEKKPPSRERERG